MSVSTFRVERQPSATRAPGKDTAAPAYLTVPHFPSLTSTVPRELVHRASIAEVMLTGWEREDDTHFTVSAQLPRRHGFFETVQGCHDPLLIAETVRQAGLLLAHTEFGVPFGHQFLMWNLAVDLRCEHLLVGATPASLDIHVTCTDIKRRGAQLSGLHFTAEIRREGVPAATGAAAFTCTSPAVYRRLRAARLNNGTPAPLPLTSPTAPQTVGRHSPTDVVLSPLAEPDCWQLRVDTRHPVLFDHPLDHVPGMALLEAARQAATAYTGRTCLPAALTAEFARYAELDTPTIIKAHPLPPHPDGRDRLLITGHQNNTPIFTTTITINPTQAPVPAQAPAQAPMPVTAHAPAQAPAPAPAPVPAQAQAPVPA
ncbi:ScbA/BarX family gamma-butyrolactone biosynthesis protein [Streptomyces asoensis]|uniref:ScbA/BarX family gamma-butyrolactone biosynthesis protein n=1 Tax=Streptomyces asoensis TaxID=249586 RepID=UPI0033CA0670